MSSLIDWVYKDPRNGGDFKIICRSFIRYESNGKAVYSDPFEIRGYFKDEIKEIANENGSVSISSREYFTDSNKIKMNDLVGGRRVMFVGLINTIPFGETILDYRILAE